MIELTPYLSAMFGQSILFLVIGFLIKHELTDIKRRIERIENVFITTKEL